MDSINSSMKQSGEIYYQNRLQLVTSLDKNIAYPHITFIPMSIPIFHKLYHCLTNNEISQNEPINLAGRITKIRGSGKIYFIDIISEEYRMQLILRSGITENFSVIIHSINRGDIISSIGQAYRSKTGELSLSVTKLDILNRCLRILPEKIEHKETRFRQRYLDFITNRENIKTFKIRADVINFIRSYLNHNGFLEVETPILGTIPSGANARPFETHHNELNHDMFLRIAPELYLKTLIIGGFEKVFEIGKQFRNEGLNCTHNPEFTSCEFYWAYKDYNFLMDRTEELLNELVITINKKYHNRNDAIVTYESTELNFSPPYQKIDVIPKLEELTGTKIENINSCEFLLQLCQTHNVPIKEPYTIARLYDSLISHFIEPLCIQPTFVMNHPRIMSPLAKWHRDNGELAERFELFVMQKELCNSYTELNCSMEQKMAFDKQLADANKGDNEAMATDNDYLLAMEYGLPPTAGWGLGIDRLVMFLTNNTSIREVILFPTMKPY